MEGTQTLSLNRYLDGQYTTCPGASPAGAAVPLHPGRVSGPPPPPRPPPAPPAPARSTAAGSQADLVVENVAKEGFKVVAVENYHDLSTAVGWKLYETGVLDSPHHLFSRQEGSHSAAAALAGTAGTTRRREPLRETFNHPLRFFRSVYGTFQFIVNQTKFFFDSFYVVVKHDYLPVQISN